MKNLHIGNNAIMINYLFVILSIILGFLNLITNYRYLPYYFILLPILAFILILDDAKELK